MLLCDNVPQRLNLVKYFDNSPPLFSFLGIVAFKVGYGAVIKNFSQNDKKNLKTPKQIICMGSASWGERNIRLHSGKVSQDVKRNHLLFLFVLV
jgi:hypothetical protein